MASPYDQDGQQEEEEVAAERELADDAMWKVIQKNTFTRLPPSIEWANENLKPAKVAIGDLEKDLSDGLKLINLIECLSGKKFQKFNRRPTFRTQKFENVTMTLKFLEHDEGIRLVNIDSSDIVDSKLKLIMGLIWTLILHYSISMPMWDDEDPSASKDQTPKQRLLAWIQSKIPEKKITNFTSDWNDGTALAALVDALAPGTFPDWRKWSPKDPLKNAKAAEDAAEKLLDIPQMVGVREFHQACPEYLDEQRQDMLSIWYILRADALPDTILYELSRACKLIKPDEMTNPKVDELSMMTYLSRFPNAKSKGGPAPVKTGPAAAPAPAADKVNPARCKAYGPGIEPTGNVVGAPARFIVETAGAGKGDLQVIAVNPKGVQEKVEWVANNDLTVSYNCVYYPTVEGQYKITVKYASKDIPKSPFNVQVAGKPGDPSKCYAQGPGIEPKGVKVKRKTYFEVITKGAGLGVVDVGIIDPTGKKDTIKTTITKKSDDVWYVEYTPLVAGLHSVNIYFAGKPIPKSPYAVAVSAETGALLDPSKLPKPQALTPREAALASIATPLKAAPGSTAREPEDQPLTAAPAGPGSQAAPGTPGDGLKRAWATGRGIQPKGVRIGEVAEFTVHTENAGPTEQPKVMIMGPGGVAEKFTTKKVGTSYEYTYKPMKAGTYIITINFDGKAIPKSPFKVEVTPTKQSKVKAYGPGLESGIVNQPCPFTVEPNGEGPIGFKIEGPSQAKIDVQKDPQTGTMEVTYLPTIEGEYAVHVLSNNDDIPKSPFMADIKPLPAGVNPGKVIASGPGLERVGVIVNKQTEFTVDTRQAGTATLEVTIYDVDGAKLPVLVTDNKNGTYTCRYTATRTVKYLISIQYGYALVPKSPFKVYVSELGAPGGPGAAPAAGAGASKVKVYGPALEGPIKPRAATHFIVDCKEAGPGQPQVLLVDARNMPIAYKMADNKDGTFKVDFTPVTVGVYTLTVNFAGQPAPGSPFKINVDASAPAPGAGNPSKVKVYGPALEGPVPTNTQTHLIIDCKEAGPGEPMFSMLSDKGQVVQYKITKNADRTYKVEFELTVVGTYNANVFFTGKPVPGSPFRVTAEQATAASKVKVYGPALEQPVYAYQTTYLIVDCKEAGDGQPLVSLVNDKGAQVPYKLIDNKDRTFKVEFQATVTGIHTANVFFQSKPVPKSPFKIDVQPATGPPADLSKITVRGLPETVPINKETPFEVVTAGAGPGIVKATVTAPSGRNFPVIIDQKPDVAGARFTPNEPGPHTVAVTFNDQPVPNSPFRVTAQATNPNLVRVYGPALERPVAPYEETYLIVDCKEAGPGQPAVSLLDTKGQTVPFKLLDNHDQTYRVEFSAITTGTIVANVVFAGQPVPKSPFRVTVQSGVRVYGPAVEGPVAPNQTTFLIIDCKEAGPGQPQVQLSTEQGQTLPGRLTDNGDRTYRVEFEANVPTGTTLLAAVSYNNAPVPQSPFRIQVSSGGITVKDLPKTVPVGRPVPFSISTGGAGPGQVKVSQVSPSGRVAPAPVGQTPEGFVSQVLATEPGTQQVHVTFNDQPVPNSPFSVVAVPDSQLPSVTVKDLPETVPVGRAVPFGIVTGPAGPGQPKVNILTPSSQLKPAPVAPGPDGFVSQIQATEPGPHEVYVSFNDEPIQRSPFKVTAVPDGQDSVPTVKDLPKTVPVGRPVPFNISTGGAGPGQLKVSQVSPSGRVAPAPVGQTPEGFVSQVLATEPGPQQVHVTFNDQPVPNSPFSVVAVPDSQLPNVTVKDLPETVPLGRAVPFGIVTGPAGPGQPKVNILTPSSKLKPAPVAPGPDGFVSQIQATEPGPHEVYVSFNDEPIQRSPFKVTAVPDGQGSAPTVKDLPKTVPLGRPVPFTITTPGPGQVKVNQVSPSGRVAPAPVGQTPEGFVSQVLATEPGPQQVHVTFNDQPVPNSPFSVVAVPDSQLPNVTVKDLPENVPIGKAVPFHVSTPVPGPVKVTQVSPSGKVTPAPVGQTPEGFVSQVLATEPGPHAIHLTFNDQAVQNSPFKVNAVPQGQAPGGPDQPKVKAYGPGLQGGTAKSPADFTVDTSEAGPGALGLTIDGPTKAEIECVDKGAGVYDVRYWPTEPGDYVANILYDDKPIPGSPFTAHVQPAQVIDVSGVKVYGPGVESGVLMESVTEFTVDAKSVTPKTVGKPKALLTTPTSAVQEIPLVDNKDGTYTALYTPFEEGPHKIDVTYNDQPVPKSPFTTQAKPGCDPSKVKAYGPGLQGAQPQKPAKFTISTRGAGAGGIGLSVVGPTEPKVSCSDNQDGTLAVEYLADSLGDHEIGITFNNEHIPGSPFHVNVTEQASVNPNAVKCYGPGLNPEGVRKGTTGVFTVDTTEAGEAKLEVVTTDVLNAHRITNEVVKVKEGVYDVAYVPDFEGPCRVDVTYAGQPVPNSPFTSQIQPSSDLSKVFVSGEGVNPSEPLPASIPASFVVDTRKAGVTQQLDVDVKGPHGKPVQPSIQPVGDGTYLVSYTPVEVGPHTVAVKYAGKDIPTGPIRVNAVPTGDASKVKVPVETVKRTLRVAEESVIVVRKEEAGYGNITATVTTTATTETIEATVTDNMDGTVTIRYTPVRAGVYKLDLKFGGVTVPYGHIEQTVEETTVGVETLERVSSVQQQFAQSAPQEAPLYQQAPSALVDVPGVQPAPQEGVPSPYHPTEFSVKIGEDFKQTDAIITTPSGVKHRPRISQNPNGTVKVNYQPVEFGQHTLEVFYAGSPVPKSPFTFFVHEKKPGSVSAFGPGLTSGVAGQPTSFTVVTKDAGPGGLGLGIEGPSKAQIQCKDNKDGTATITYTPVTPGEYKITVKFAGQPIQGAPFTAKVTPAEFVQEAPLSPQEFLQAHSVQQLHTSRETTERTSHVTVGKTSIMSISTTESDLTNLTATIRAPSGLEEPCLLKRQPTGQLGISFTPRESGDHYVSVFRNGQPIPGSPFKIFISAPEVANASKVKITGQGQFTATANQINTFNINTKEAGVGGLSLSVVGPSKVEIKCDENPDGTTRVSYKPTEPGQYQLTIKYADEHVPGSPFTINAGGVGSGRVTESIVRQQQATQTTTSAGSTCELNIKMAGINVRDLEGTVTAPSGTVSRIEVVDKGDNKFTVRFNPTETGVHIVSLKNKGFHIPGSPFQFTVGPIAGGGPHKVKALGSGLERGEVNKPNPFTIITREAGPGNLSLGIEGPSKAKIDFQDKRDGTSDVTYVVTEPGEYLITVKYNGEPIPDSPFKVFIAAVTGETQKLHVQNLQQQGLAVNTPSQFTVDFNGAQGRLEAKVIAPSGTETDAVVQEVQKDKYAVNFVPQESGVHQVHVKLNGNHVPGSPYPIQVGRQDADAGKVIAYGDGLVKGQTGQICKFIVNTANAGSGALSIGISGPSKVELQCREVEEGYEFSYTPLAPGDYIITIKYAGNSHIPGSPFKASIEGAGKPAQFSEESRVVVQTVTKTTTTTTTQLAQQQFQRQLSESAQQQTQALQQPAGDASKVRASGPGLQHAVVNQETMFSIDGSNAGFNMLLMGIAGPTIPCESLTAIHLGRLQYTVKYRLSMPGQYVLVVKWGDQHIPGSPYRIVAQ